MKNFISQTDAAATAVKLRLQAWLVELFIAAIKSISKEEDRMEVLVWLSRSQDVVSSDKPIKDKFAELYSLMDGAKTAKIVLNSVTESVKNYRSADLPLAVKISLPITLLAMPFVGLHGAGIAAFGGAIGLPVFLLIFLGTTGIAAILEPFAASKEARNQIVSILTLIACAEAMRRINAAVETGTQGPPTNPVRCEMPEDEREIRAKLLTMDPYSFERHVMSFFEAAGLQASVTKKSSDMGVDGFAQHAKGLIVVQCKRNAPENLIGSPTIQQFKGVIEENAAFMGYLVTTAAFTERARTSARQSSKLALVEMKELVAWHQAAPTFSTDSL